MARKQRAPSTMKKYKLRYDKETGDPVLVIVNQIKLFCHEEVSEQTEDGDIIDLKMRPTTIFVQALNRKVIELMREAIYTARMDDRIELRPEDVPGFEELGFEVGTRLEDQQGS